MHKLTQCICIYRSDDVQLISADSLVAGEPGKPCSNLLILINEKALIEILILCVINIQLQWKLCHLYLISAFR